MPNEVQEKQGSSTALTITLASLASSTTRVGRQSTIVDNTTVQAPRVLVHYKIKQGTSPTGSKAVYFYLIRGDANGTAHRDGEAGASDAGLTIAPNLSPIHIAANKSSPSTGDVLQGSFLVEAPGPKWGIAVVHDTGVDLDSTGSNHWIRYETLIPEVQ